MPDENKKKAQVETHNENQQHHQQQYTHQKKANDENEKKTCDWVDGIIHVLYYIMFARSKWQEKTDYKRHGINHTD